MNRISEAKMKTLKRTLELPRTTEEQAQAIASRVNQRLAYSWTSIGWRYRVLNHYPSGALYLALVGR